MLMQRKGLQRLKVSWPTGKQAGEKRKICLRNFPCNKIVIEASYKVPIMFSAEEYKGIRRIQHVLQMTVLQ